MSTVKPLSDSDVTSLLEKISQCDSKITNPLFIEYSNTLNSLLSIIVTQLEEESEIVELERVKRILSLCPLEEKLLRTKDKIWNVREHILAKNKDYFLNKDYSSLIKQDSNKAFIENIMEIIKDNFNDLSEKEQAAYWIKAKKLLNIVARFKKAIGEV